MSTATPGDARPPVASQAIEDPGVVVRPTVRVRPLLPVRLRPVSSGFEASDPYVRRFWVAAIGAGAVAELLRLIRAGADNSEVVLPRWLPVLMRADLVTVIDGVLVVVSRVPIVPPALQRRFHPGLRHQHRRWDQRRVMNAESRGRPRP